MAARRDLLVSWNSRNKVAARALDSIYEDGDMDYQNAEFLGELAKARALCGRHKDAMRVLKVLKDDFSKDRSIRRNLVLLSMLLIRTKRYGHAIRYLAKVHKHVCCDLPTQPGLSSLSLHLYLSLSLSLYLAVFLPLPPPPRQLQTPTVTRAATSSQLLCPIDRPNSHQHHTARGILTCRSPSHTCAGMERNSLTTSSTRSRH